MSPALIAVVVWLVRPPVLFGLGLLVTWPERRRNVERARRRALDALDVPTGRFAGPTTHQEESA